MVIRVCVSFRGVPRPRDDEESRTALKTLRARFLSRNCGIGMTRKFGLSHRLLGKGREAPPAPASSYRFLLSAFCLLLSALRKSRLGHYASRLKMGFRKSKRLVELFQGPKEISEGELEWWEGFFSVFSVAKKRSNTEVPEPLGVPCVEAFRPQRAQRRSFWLRPW